MKSPTDENRIASEASDKPKDKIFAKESTKGMLY